MTDIIAMTDEELSAALDEAPIFDPSTLGFFPTHLLLEHCGDSDTFGFQCAFQTFISRVMASPLISDRQSNMILTEMRRRIAQHLVSIDKEIHTLTGGKIH